MARVVSLLPSATEIVCLVAAECDADGTTPALVAKSHECDWPPGLDLPMLTAAKTTFTTSADVDQQVRSALASGNGLYTVDQEHLKQLQPDVIVTQSLCSVCSVDFCQVELVAAGIEPPPKLIDLNPANLQDVLADVERVGAELGQPAAGKAAADKLRARLQAALNRVPTAAPGRKPPSVAFIEWVEPIFVGGHWTPQLIHMAGGSHPLNPHKAGGGAGKSFVATAQQVAGSQPDWIVVSPCGLDLATTRKELDSTLATQAWWQELTAVKAGQVVCVDGNQHFNRPGPRLIDALEFLVGLLHDQPELIPADFPFERRGLVPVQCIRVFLCRP
ncbi:hypothetical protein D9Q98_009755 [Chlorella vulgaris]|uniref:Fe/B12 periplasmic-binding domain-containing protein n=1 Tax=Chlorella vulgaris TaxID=3077 RepID=A0A9D4YSE2_CHLVU|nr:hypothetical protein D9Q98_009755 [Chlorella vulgaris]